MSSTESCLIWSNNHGMWWRPCRSGYTQHIDEAGRYGPTEAQRIVAHSTCGGQLVHERTNPVTGEVYQEMATVIVAVPDAMGAYAELLAEVEQLRYERRLLGSARMTLDLVASGPPDRWEYARREAEDIAQRIVDEIGHPVTSEDALGPDMRQQITTLTADTAHLADILDNRASVAEQLAATDGLTVDVVLALIAGIRDTAAQLHAMAGTASVYAEVPE
jgi:hypothetical protein